MGSTPSDTIDMRILCNAYQEFIAKYFGSYLIYRSIIIFIILIILIILRINMSLHGSCIDERSPRYNLDDT